MNVPKGRLGKSLILLLSMFFMGINDIRSSRAYGETTIEDLHPAEIASASEMGEAVSHIEKYLVQAISEGRVTADLQRQVLIKSGECISALVALQAGASGRKKTARQKEKNIFLNIRSLLKQVLQRNESIIQDIQENKLDTLDDPSSFLKSPAWQDPHYLISLSSYWMGWNGYYTSMFFADGDPMIDTLLTEAINGFSRSFIDFKEDAVITRSLLGRALCYGKQKAYERARRDLVSVKKKVGRDDPLFIRCLYEEVRMLYETGNYELASRTIDELKEDFPDEKIPEHIRLGLDQINAKIVVALVQKEEKKDTDALNLAKKPLKKTLETLRQLGKDPAGMAEVYRYVKENAPDFEGFSYAELGPVAATALGDVMFERKAFDRALAYYLPVIKDTTAKIGNRLDGIWFHTAYIYCKKDQYGKALFYLKRFQKKFPKSALLEQAVSLYYVAGNRQYQKENSQRAYNIFIDAVGSYIKRCGGNCPEMSDAHFNMGKHYQQLGDTRKAASEFSKVHSNSPNYVSAKYAELQFCVDELALLEKSGQRLSRAAKDLHAKGVGLLKAYQKGVASNKELSGHAKKVAPYMLVLASNLSIYGDKAEMRHHLNRLKHFEKEYPREKNLRNKAFQIRMIMYQCLYMQEDAEEELLRLAKAPVNQGTYAALKRLAEKFDRDGRAIEAVSDGNAERYWDFALMTYDCLHKISCGSSEKIEYCDTAQLAMARIYTDRDQLEKAEAVYQDILKRNSLSADAVYNLGNLYEKKENWEMALDTWRTFSDGVKSGTYHWFEARYKTAFALSKLGDVAKACDVLNITLVLHPDLGSDELKAKYQTLKSNICKEESPL